jgi:hypothetical protein
MRQPEGRATIIQRAVTDSSLDFTKSLSFGACIKHQSFLRRKKFIELQPLLQTLSLYNLKKDSREARASK